MCEVNWTENSLNFPIASSDDEDPYVKDQSSQYYYVAVVGNSSFQAFSLKQNLRFLAGAEDSLLVLHFR